MSVVTQPPRHHCWGLHGTTDRPFCFEFKAAAALTIKKLTAARGSLACAGKSGTPTRGSVRPTKVHEGPGRAGEWLAMVWCVVAAGLSPLGCQQPHTLLITTTDDRANVGGHDNTKGHGAASSFLPGWLVVTSVRFFCRQASGNRGAHLIEVQCDLPAVQPREELQCLPVLCDFFRFREEVSPHGDQHSSG